MSRSEQMGKIRERLIKKRDEVFEAHRLGAGLEHFNNTAYSSGGLWLQGAIYTSCQTHRELHRRIAAWRIMAQRYRNSI